MKAKKVRFIDMFNAIKDTEPYKVRMELWRLSKNQWGDYSLYVWKKGYKYATTVKDMYDSLIKNNEKSKN